MHQHIEHGIEPVYDKESKVLILGTMPSPRSRQEGIFYGHPQNRFWRIMSALFHEELPKNNEERRALMLKNHIAVWDVLKSCDIVGADDSSIKNPVPNDIDLILKTADIRAIFTTGSKAYSLYQKYIFSTTNKAAFKLPSTSPANCGCPFEKLLEEYSVIKPYLECVDATVHRPSSSEISAVLR